MSVPVILRSTLAVIGHLGSQTPHSDSGEGDRRNGVPFVLWVLFGVVVWDLGFFKTLYS